MNLQARVKAVLTSPKTEWEVIATEATDVAALYKNYIVILAGCVPSLVEKAKWRNLLLTKADRR